jgi:DNA-binding transcriptional LysR family regulator
MDIHRLEVFCRVVELKSFTRAAESCSLSQPTVSEHIRGLEALLGHKLLERIKGGVQPTPVGRVFYQYARTIVQTRNDALEAVEQFQGKITGSLIIGASSIPGTYLLPLFVSSFVANHPDCQIELRISDTQETVDSVAEGSLEIGLVGAKLTNRKVAFEEVAGDELVLAVTTDHRWASKQAIVPEELSEEPFISRERGSGTLWVTNQVLEQSGFNTGNLKVSAKMDTSESVRQGIKAGVGVSILSRRAVDEDVRQGALSTVEISGIRFFRSLYLAFHKNRQLSPLGSAFLNHVRERVRTMG